jgi:hypothetical protein
MVEVKIKKCLICYKEFHKKYGIKNNTREQLEEFLDYTRT